LWTLPSPHERLSRPGVAYMLKDLQLESWEEQKISVSFNRSRPGLGPTRPPIQWVPGFFGGVKPPGREVDHSPLM
jgi:hypothetical protein